MGSPRERHNADSDVQPSVGLTFLPPPELPSRHLSILPRPQSSEPSSPPGEFWPDVFVESGLPWRGFFDSTLYHALAITILWVSGLLWWNRPHIVPPAAFNRADVIYYPESEYLPPLNSRPHISYQPQRGDPEFARQEIISVPAEADNKTQTIVTPPQIKLDHDVPMPNIVAWSPEKVAVPLAATARSAEEMKLPELPSSVVAPPPDANMDARLHTAAGLQPSAVGPPPSVQMAAIRQVGDIDIGHSDVVAPAPQLPMAEQHRVGGSGGASTLGSPAVVPPPPSLATARDSGGGGQLIALSVRPAPAAPVQAPEGNRRGTFAATPQGKPGAPGTPDMPAGTGNGRSSTGGDAPAGLYIGPGGGSSAIQGTNTGRSGNEPREMTSANPPRVTASSHEPVREVSPDKATDEEKKVFAGRKFYGMSLNMPNLNSGGGSWVIHFAELEPDSPQGDLSAPVAVRKVDPAYPTELMRQNVSGTVTLSAVIHSDGSVDAVRVLSSGDDRLNEYARSALLRWRFQPATKNGKPVDLQAVVMIPFRPIRWQRSF